MPPADVVPYVIAAVIGALVLFTAVLGVGWLVVKGLKLPQDLPDGPRFEPPPPPLVSRPDPVAAKLVAAAQVRRQVLFADVRTAHAAAQALKEIVAVCGPYAATHAAAIATIRTAATAAAAAATAAEPAMRLDDLSAAEVLARTQAGLARAAWNQAEPAVRTLPDPGAGRRRTLIILLVIVLVFYLLVWLSTSGSG